MSSNVTNYHLVGIVATNTASADNADCCSTNYRVNRMYMSFTMPTLPRNPRIKKAELRFYQANSYPEYGINAPLIGLYQVTDTIQTGSYTPGGDSKLIDFARIRYGKHVSQEPISYSFDITTLIDEINKNESNNSQLVLKLLNEGLTSSQNTTLYSSSSGDYAPEIIITYESSYGVNTSYRTHTHELGRFGQDSVDLQCGNLMFESEDFAWSGNRMPVTIKHLYNSALAGIKYTQISDIGLYTANFSKMTLGWGFRLNLMQSMIPMTSFMHEGKSYSGYVYIGENGEETYFKKSSKKKSYYSKLL